MDRTAIGLWKRFVAMAAAFAFTLGGFTVVSAVDAYADSGDISLKKAKSIALKKAGLKASRVTFTSAHRERDDGRSIYDVEFCHGNWEYSFEIAAKTGRIIEWDKDYEHDHTREHGHGHGK